MTHNKAHNALVVCLPHPDGHPGHPPVAPIPGLPLIAGKPIVVDTLVSTIGLPPLQNGRRHFSPLILHLE